MYNDYMQQNLVDNYHAERLAQARRERLVNQACCGRPALRQRFLTWSGDRLIDAGRSLKARYEPLTAPALAPENGAKIEA